ncbi:MAG: thioesterase family protein [Spirochaetes bacterium]|jgi:uncharacterized protein (TIGR00369 family)|nr:thioesterase family protein [Spirochaetota bacterium]
MEKEIVTRELLQGLVKQLFEEHIPFNRYVGLQFIESRHDYVEIKIGMREELVGNFYHKMLHGGVIASILDVAGGLVAMLSTIEKIENLDVDYLRKRLVNVGTIDIHVNFLLPGRGEAFTATAVVIRQGSKVAVTRMELKNEKNNLIAIATATYIVG